jgi:hypothetical protein
LTGDNKTHGKGFDMTPEHRQAARARCEATETVPTAESAALARADLLAALDALDAADEGISEFRSLIDSLAERVHSQSEKLSHRAERKPPP